MCVVLDGCECYAAVTRVYRELRERDVSDAAAFDTATRVYLFYHPEEAGKEAPHRVAQWIEEFAAD